MSTKTWTSKADFDTGTLSNLVDHRNNDLQIKCTWSAGGNLNTARRNLAGCGTQTSGLSFGGYTTTSVNNTEEYTGTSWCTGGNLITARNGLSGCGTQTAGLSFGGETTVVKNTTEEYTGTSWCTGGNLNTARAYLAGAGTQTAGLNFGGTTGTISAVAEEYNGSSWCTGGNLNTAKQQLAGCGTQTAGLSFGGYDDVVVLNKTEEYNGSSWCTGGNLNTARRALAGCGTQIAGLSFGGVGPSVVTEEYNGTLWSAGGNLNTARTPAGCGIQTSGLSFGGYDGSNNKNTTEEYNLGSSGTWTVDFDSGSATTHWGYLSWTNAGGGSVKARCKSAANQTLVDSSAVKLFVRGDTQTDESASAHTLTFNGGASANGWLNFDGNADYISAASMEALGTANFTIDFIINTTTTDTSAVYNRGTGDNQNIIVYMSPVGKIYLADGGGNLKVGLTTAAVNNGSDHHVAIVREGTAANKTYIYIDGVKDATGTFSESVATGTGYIGGYNATQHWFLGKLKHFRVTTTARWTGASFTPPLEDLKDVLWYPTGGSGYYTTQPQDVECPHNEWYRLEVTLTEGSTPEVTEINQNYGEDC